MYDLIIIGAGPAGLSAAIYGARRALKTLVLSKDIGGQAVYPAEVENYPGFQKISGFELMNKMKKQAESFGAEIKSVDIKDIAQERENFKVKDGEENVFLGRAIILCFGAVPRKLGVEGEDKFKGHGISYCATCDAPFYKNKVAAVVGGGNAAVDAAILLAKMAKKVYLIHRRGEFSAEEERIAELKQAANVEFILNAAIKAVKGDKSISGIVVSNIDGSNEKEIEVNGIFVEIGHIVDSSFVEKLIARDEKDQIIINQKNETNMPGVFAAGDATTVPYKQIVIAAGEGAKAALSAYGYLQKKSI